MIEDYKYYAKCELARRHFWNYCQMMAGDYYTNDRAFLKDLCDRLDDFSRNNKKILVINLPPRHGKSRTASLFTEWLLGQDISKKVMTGSYNETLSSTFAKTVRDTIAERKIPRRDVI